MISANQQKFITSLHLKKFRQKYRNFLVEGEKMVKELLQQQQLPIVQLYGTERWATENAALLAPIYHKFNLATEADLKKVGTLTTPNQVLAVVEMPPAAAQLPDLSAVPLALYLDGLQDPGNMGTILRIADWFGIRCVMASPDTVDAYSPKVIQAGMGACLRVRTWEDVPLATLTQQYPHINVLGAVMDGDNVFAATVPNTGILVIGNEGRGIRPEHMAQLTHRITIPRGADNGAESLNAAVAAGIIVARLVAG